MVHSQRTLTPNMEVQSLRTSRFWLYVTETQSPCWYDSVDILITYEHLLLSILALRPAPTLHAWLEGSSSGVSGDLDAKSNII